MFGRRCESPRGWKFDLFTMWTHTHTHTASPSMVCGTAGWLKMDKANECCVCFRTENRLKCAKQIRELHIIDCYLFIIYCVCDVHSVRVFTTGDDGIERQSSNDGSKANRKRMDGETQSFECDLWHKRWNECRINEANEFGWQMVSIEIFWN